MANQIQIIIQAQDNASKKIRSLGDEIDSTGKKLEAASRGINNLGQYVGGLATITAGAGLSTRGLLNVMNESVGSANQMQAALTGLNSVAVAFGSDATAAKRAAQDLAKDGLMTVTDSATGLKNLLASGFSLDQAVILMKRFKDSAAFGRQSALSFGQAISSATKGIKNGNSILVDNAGVTKNLSVMLTEAGFRAQDLMLATSDASVRQAIFNGILKETNVQAGDAAKLADSAAGKQAVWAAQTEILNQKIGVALQPALLALLQVVTPLITSIAGWVEKNPELAAGIIIASTAVAGLVTVAGSLGLAVIGLGPIFGGFATAAGIAIGGVSTAYGALATLIASPLALPLIAVAGAIAALWSVKTAYDGVMAAFKSEGAAGKASFEAGEQLRASAEKRYRAGKIDAKEWKRLMDVSFNASGTNSDRGGLSLVGEHGPEIVNLPTGSAVTPAYQTRQLSSSTSPSVIIQNYNSYNERDDDRFFRDIGFALANAS